MEKLQECFEVISSPKSTQSSHDSANAPTGAPTASPTSAKASVGSAMGYFKRIKQKNHYTYHKFKKTPKPAAPPSTHATTTFDPFSRAQLLDRLATYSPLTWNVPDLSLELKCAQNGWKCLLISVNNYNKNHVMCVLCMKMMTLRYNPEVLDGALALALDEALVPDPAQLDSHLTSTYLDQIVSSAHDINCPWRHFETPLDIYYLKPYLQSTSDILVAKYLQNLYDLILNRTLLEPNRFQFPDKYNLPEFFTCSNRLLLNKFYGANKENQLVETVPGWFYLVALMGWDLKVQVFGQHAILFLVCGDCNKKVFVAPLVPGDRREPGTSPALALVQPPSNILTPVKIPPSNIAQYHDNHPDPYHTNHDDDQLDDDNDDIDLLTEHKTWCSMNETLIDYLYSVILAQDRQGQEKDESYHQFSTTPSSTPTKRRNEFDVMEGLERLNKLRKLYLED